VRYREIKAVHVGVNASAIAVTAKIPKAGTSKAGILNTWNPEVWTRNQATDWPNLWKLLPGNCTFSTIISGDFHLTEG
jgi:hypothetical protein